MAICIHDILHGVGILLSRKYYTGGSATITVLLVAWPHILLLKTLLRHCCWQLCCDATDAILFTALSHFDYWQLCCIITAGSYAVILV
ncbi:hypothetical protein Goshw_002031 [Gossypium schwendimanii]|uniref:Uncharacterized protein n=1 Tax=Gossypium schwendimanii TaxID=34291 RepID=A0A7J9LDD8_GOSSC|nr:hypothetical protein [Gossypium schwendimanii]